MWFLYILECENGALYTGVTLDVARRMEEHSSGKGSKYLCGNRPVKLVYKESFSDKSQALKREAEIKRWPRRKKQALISGDGSI